MAAANGLAAVISGGDNFFCQMYKGMLVNDLAGGTNAFATFRTDTQLTVNVTQGTGALVQSLANLMVADVVADTDFHGSARGWLDTEW